MVELPFGGNTPGLPIPQPDPEPKAFFGMETFNQAKKIVDDYIQNYFTGTSLTSHLRLHSWAIVGSVTYALDGSETAFTMVGPSRMIQFNVTIKGDRVEIDPVHPLQSVAESINQKSANRGGRMYCPDGNLHQFREILNSAGKRWRQCLNCGKRDIGPRPGS